MKKNKKNNGYKWNFASVGGTVRVRISSGEDIVHLGELDPKLWTVLSCLLSPYGADTWWIGASVRREGLATQLCYLFLCFCFILSLVNLKAVLVSAAAGVALTGTHAENYAAATNWAKATRLRCPVPC